MKRSNALRGGLRGTRALSMALLVGLGVAGWAAVARAEEGTSGRQEGIKVHGHWTIEVREPDGTLVTRREFQNALGPAAPALLAGFLGRQNSVGLWAVLLFTTGALQPCAGQTCEIVETGSPELETLTTFKTLTVTVPTSGNDAGKIVLNGTATVRTTTTINRVSTTVHACPSNVAPATPCSVGPVMLTLGTTSVSVSNGQIVQVTVVISFS